MSCGWYKSHGAKYILTEKDIMQKALKSNSVLKPSQKETSAFKGKLGNWFTRHPRYTSHYCKFSQGRKLMEGNPDHNFYIPMQPDEPVTAISHRYLQLSQISSSWRIPISGTISKISTFLQIS